jgi:hypothetical protein
VAARFAGVLGARGGSRHGDLASLSSSGRLLGPELPELMLDVLAGQLLPFLVRQRPKHGCGLREKSPPRCAPKRRTGSARLVRSATRSSPGTRKRRSADRGRRASPGPASSSRARRAAVRGRSAAACRRRARARPRPCSARASSPRRASPTAASTARRPARPTRGTRGCGDRLPSRPSSDRASVAHVRASVVRRVTPSAASAAAPRGIGFKPESCHSAIWSWKCGELSSSDCPNGSSESVASGPPSRAARA